MNEEYAKYLKTAIEDSELLITCTKERICVLKEILKEIEK